jgi:hypothetical protein
MNLLLMMDVLFILLAKEKMYRRGITKYLTQALEDFIIWGELENEEFEYFNSNSDYEAFIIQRKTKELW